MGTTLLAIATPASAGPVYRASPAEAAVVGKPTSGITYVAEKDVLRVRSEQAASAASQAAAAGQWFCMDDWHYITGGGANAYWKPDASGYVYANGNRNSDFWNQQLLPCWLNGWELHAWAFLSNRTGKFIDVVEPQLRAATPSNVSTSFANIYLKFLVCDYDGNWKYLERALSDPANISYVYRTPANSSIRLAFGPLSGNHLFRIEPTIAFLRCPLM
jgi:hypothetical protein